MIAFNIASDGYGYGPHVQSATRVVVRGRIYSGPIRVGDVFTTVFLRKSHIDKDPKSIEIRLNERAIALRIERVTSYDRNWAELDEGMTAELELSGQGADSLKPDEDLTG